MEIKQCEERNSMKSKKGHGPCILLGTVDIFFGSFFICTLL